MVGIKRKIRMNFFNNHLLIKNNLFSGIIILIYKKYKKGGNYGSKDKYNVSHSCFCNSN